MLCIMFSKRDVQCVASVLEAYACTLVQQCSCVYEEGRQTTTSPTELSVNQGVYCTHVPRNASANLYRHKTSTAPRLIYAAVSSAPAGTCAMIYSRAALGCATTSPPTAPTTLICMDYIRSFVLPYQLLLIIVLRLLQIRFTVYPGN